MATSIYRGDSDEWTLTVPLTLWSAGGKFFFGIKSKGDFNPPDLLDATAVLKKTYDDSFITSTTATNKVYTLKLLPGETLNAAPGKYLAQFKWMNASALSNVNAVDAIQKTFDSFKYEIKGTVNQRVSG